MNADQLWETTMNPESRTLIRVVIDDQAQAERRVSALMENKVEPRRKWIESHMEFILEDGKSILETEGHLTVNEQPKLSKTKKEEINSPSSVEQLSLLMEEE